MLREWDETARGNGGQGGGGDVGGKNTPAEGTGWKATERQRGQTKTKGQGCDSTWEMANEGGSPLRLATK